MAAAYYPVVDKCDRLLSISGVAAAYYPGADKCEPTASPSLRRQTLAATDGNLDYVSILAVALFGLVWPFCAL